MKEKMSGPVMLWRWERNNLRVRKVTSGVIVVALLAVLLPPDSYMMYDPFYFGMVLGFLTGLFSQVAPPH